MSPVKRPPCPKKGCRQVSRKRVGKLPTRLQRTQLYRCWDDQCAFTYALEPRTNEPGYTHLEMKRPGEYAFFDQLTGEFLFVLHFRNIPEAMLDILRDMDRLPWLVGLKNSQPPAN